jgi:hypothetical protein
MSVSSLIKSAQSNKARANNYEDQIVKFDFDSSAKTYSDYEQYNAHIEERIKTTNDPSKQLSYQSSSRSAYRTFATHEIQRQSQAVMGGYGDDGQKLNTILGLQQTAIDMGDFDTAQSLNGQVIGLENKLQAAGERAARDARSQFQGTFKETVRNIEAKADEALDIANDMLQYNGLEGINAVGEQMLREAGIIDRLVESGKITQEQSNRLSVGYFGVQSYSIQAAIDELEVLATTLPAGDELLDTVYESIQDLKTSKIDIPGYASVTAEKLELLTSMEQQGISPFRQVSVSDDITGDVTQELALMSVKKFEYIQDSKTGKFERRNVYAELGEPLLFDTDTEVFTKEDKAIRSDMRDEVKNQLRDIGFNILDVKNGQVIVERTEQAVRKLGIPAFVRTSPDGRSDIESGAIGNQIVLSIDNDPETGETMFTFVDNDGKAKELDAENNTISDYLPTTAREAFDDFYKQNNMIGSGRSDQDLLSKYPNSRFDSSGKTLPDNVKQQIQLAQQRVDAMKKQNSGFTTTERMSSTDGGRTFSPTLTKVATVDPVKAPAKVAGASGEKLTSSFRKSIKTKAAAKSKEAKSSYRFFNDPGTAKKPKSTLGNIANFF